MVVYILGSNGMAGSMLVTRLQEVGIDSIGLTRQDLDITKPSWQDTLAIRLRTNDSLINCIGIIPQKVSQNSETKELYMYCNGVFPHELAELCRRHSVRLIHLSTNCVFKTGNKSEDDIPDADDMYGLSKMAGEPVDKALVIRCSIIGPERNTSVSLMNWALSQTTLCGYTNHKWNGITTLELANQISSIIVEKSHTLGLLHLFSKNTLSKYELIKEIHMLWNHTATLVPSQTVVSYDKTLISTHFDPVKTIQTQLLELHIYLMEKKGTFTTTSAIDKLYFL